MASGAPPTAHSSLRNGAEDEAPDPMDAGVDAGILGVGAAQSPGDNAAELVLKDHPAA